ncbi:hypothetical protein F5876DRAFT_82304 [Lentinula aff. lateritia]|uniref:Uncharacterized protein n=1 Tax=Lentinula aff. lateritia TaxID=2804960 RepID=A0ACC1TJX4_9AGAR|nr:hypothetical protein F5876DRAFT_82304 [Lentinula aff. lateritia]
MPATASDASGTTRSEWIIIPGSSVSGVALRTMPAKASDASGSENSEQILIPSDSRSGGKAGNSVQILISSDSRSGGEAVAYRAMPIYSEFPAAHASQAFAGIAQCATGDMAYATLSSTMFGHLPASPPLLESLEIKICSEFSEPLASEAFAGIAQCATYDMAYPSLSLTMFGHLSASPPLTESLVQPCSVTFQPHHHSQTH